MTVPDDSPPSRSAQPRPPDAAGALETLGPGPPPPPPRPLRRPPDAAGALETLGRSSGPASLILSSLADGAKHGYALTKDIETFAGVRLAPGTLYEALARLDAQGLIEAVESEDRRRPYRLTAAGATALRAPLEAQRTAATVGLHRLDVNWGTR